MKTLDELFDQIAARDRPDLLWVRRGDAFEPISSERFARWVEELARALGARGIGRGDRVGLLADNRPEWHAIDFACHRLGAVLVPLFTTLTAAQARFSLGDSGCRAVFVEDAEQLDKVSRVRDRLKDVELFVVVEPPDADSMPDEVRTLEGLRREAERGATVELEGPEGPDALATIIYTSGTTGDPKGVMLTHRNILSNVDGVIQRLGFGEGDRVLSLLPLCHVFERTVDYAYLATGAAIAYSSPDRVAEDLLEIRPHVMVAVPRLFEKFREAAHSQARERGRWAARIFRWAEGLALRRARAQRGEDSGYGLIDRFLHPVADALVLRQVRAGAGGRLRFFCSGGAALDPGLNWWFEAMGLTLVQGYGLTESSPVISVNSLEDNRIGTVGPPLHNVEVRIAEDGEILTRGPHVMKGYWNQPEATAEAVEDGWLHTGDVGRLDEDGYLMVTDRKKSILVTSTGKNVAPQPVENAVKESRFIQYVAMVGDGRKFVAGLVVPDFDALEAWARERDLSGDREELCEDPRVRELFAEELERLQGDFSHYERIREFKLLPDPFSIDDGTLTPTLKVVRNEVERQYEEEIEELYRDAKRRRRESRKRGRGEDTGDAAGG